MKWTVIVQIYLGDLKMRSIIIAVLLTSVSLMAAENVKANNSGAFKQKSIDAASLYKQRCATCHGEKATKSPEKGVAALAGMDATRLALRIRAYRDQDSEVGSYTMHKNSQVMKESTVNLSREQIVALAKYISALK